MKKKWLRWKSRCDMVKFVTALCKVNNFRMAKFWPKIRRFLGMHVFQVGPSFFYDREWENCHRSYFTDLAEWLSLSLRVWTKKAFSTLRLVNVANWAVLSNAREKKCPQQKWAYKYYWAERGNKQHILWFISSGLFGFVENVGHLGLTTTLFL